MGLGLGNLLGIGSAIEGVAEVFVDNRTKRTQLAHDTQIKTLEQLSAEFARARGNWFDQFVDGLNRLPRPILAFSAVGLFAYAMKDPLGFGARMQGLALIPDPLWWLLGAIVSFYFGARELHYFRGSNAGIPTAKVAEVLKNVRALDAASENPGLMDGASGNQALTEWKNISD